MSDTERLRRYLKKATLELRETHQRNAELEAEACGPIAIVSMSCRYPGGGDSPGELWQLLASESDAVGPFPEDRGWPRERLQGGVDEPGTVSASQGAFLKDIAGFQPEAFGIAPREAVAMNPQQRLVLELAWEALDDAGFGVQRGSGRPVGVFLGALHEQYGATADSADAEAHGYMGAAASVLSGRVSYTFGLEGPAVTVDTACSSSLVAIHLASQALRRKECDAALAGGVTVMATPTLLSAFSRQRALSPDGRCRAFAATADGTGFSEGAGLLLLERLDDALTAGRRIWGVIRGSAVNQDGATNGLTAPNGSAQAAVIRRALAAAGLAPEDVDAIEAHGTGTPLGDPIELEAILDVYGRVTRRGPIRVGSLKSNVGHTSAAAGVGGIIKMALALAAEQLPRSLHIDEPTPHVAWTADQLELLTVSRPWARGATPRRAGVSSFGASGTNVHLVLEEPPAGELGSAPSVAAPPILVSGHDAEAVRRRAAELASYAELHGHGPAELVARGANLRGRHRHRSFVCAGSASDLAARLRDLASDHDDAPAIHSARNRKVALVFPGQGGQWSGMGAELLRDDADFAEAVGACDAAFAPVVGWSVAEVLAGSDTAPGLDRVDVVQPALFSMMVGLARSWQAAGLSPVAVVGHSQGEVAAAHIAGALSLDDAARVVALRSRLIASELAGSGGMAALGISADKARPLIAEHEGLISLAAVNAPDSIVLAGDVARLDAIVKQIASAGGWARRIDVDYPSHSAAVDRIAPALAGALSELTPTRTALELVSTTTGATAVGSELDAGHWFRNLRQPVLFDEAVRHLLRVGVDGFVEVSPHPVLTSAVEQIAANEGRSVDALHSLRRDDGGCLPAAFAEAHVRGVDVLPTGTKASAPRAADELPTYPFTRRHLWQDPSPQGGVAPVAGADLVAHPILAARQPVPSGGWLYGGELSLSSQPWIADHVVDGRVVLPGTAVIDLVLHAARDLGCDVIDTIAFERPIILGADPKRVQVHLEQADPDGARHFAVRTAGSAGRVDDVVCHQHASGRLVPARSDNEASVPFAPSGANMEPGANLYEMLAEGGLAYGPSLRGIAEFEIGEDDIIARLGDPGLRPWPNLHPALLDSALHTAALVDPVASEAAEATVVPVSARGVWLHPGPCHGRLQTRLTVLAPGCVRVVVDAEDGAPRARIDELRFQRLDPASTESPAAALHTLVWRRAANQPAAVASRGARPVRLAADGSEIEESIAAVDRSGAGLACWEPALDGSLPEALARVAAFLGRWLADPRTASCRLAVCTTGGVATGEDEAVEPAPAAAWGLLRSAMLERPGRLVAVDGISATDALDADLGGSEQIAVREGAQLLPSLVAAEAPPADAQVTLSDPVLITGGSGTLGRLVARRLVQQHGTRHVILLSRAAAEDGADIRDEFASQGVTVELLSCDVSDAGALTQAIAGRSGKAPIRCVLHLAGALGDALLDDVDAAHLATALSPKFDGALALEAALADTPLERFVLFGSASAVLGSPGQAAYAAANAALEAVVARRRRTGQPAQLLQWGLWATLSGLTAGVDAAGAARLRALGLAALTDDAGLALLDEALRSNLPCAVPIARVARVDDADALPAPMRQDPHGAAPPGDRARLRSLPAERRRTALEDLVRREAAKALGLEVDAQLSQDQTFKDAGFDSLTAVALRNRLDRVTGLSLPATLVFDHPTVELAATEIDRLMGAARPARPRPGLRRPGRDHRLAVVGMGCRFPGAVTTPRELWDLVAAGQDATGAFPRDRGWDLGRLTCGSGQPGASITGRGGFLEGADGFDAPFFGISPREALAMDPQQRLLLETTWEALEYANIDPHTLRGSRSGVFVGASSSGYGTRVPAYLEGLRLTGTTSSVMSGRIAYHLGLQGPALTVDTACSSSLVALHLAARSLREGESDLALVAGVAVMAIPSMFVEFSRQGGLAPDGRSKAYGELADGTSWAEGIGVVAVERLDDALARQHHVIGVVRGTAINQDGASNGLAAPNGPAQERVVLSALADAGLDVDDVDYVEGHGTGTRLGDPIELGALMRTYGQRRGGPIRLGSLKSNIGHAQAAAGIGGVIKTLMALNQEELPPTLHADEPTHAVDWAGSGVELVRERQGWPRGPKARRGAVSAFGISGTNAHVVLEEAPGSDDGPASERTPGPVTLVLSAADPTALVALAERVAGTLEAEEVDLSAAAKALAGGRAHLRWRTAIEASDRREAVDGLRALAAGPLTRRGPTEIADGRTALVFSGQGSHREGMGAALAARHPVFRSTLEEASEVLAEHLSERLIDVMLAPAGTAEARHLGRTDYAQPLLIAYHVATLRVLREYELFPHIVLGHSVGEISAAHVAGVLSFADALRLAAARGALLGALPAGGGMLAVAAAPERARELAGSLVEVAAVNGPKATVLTGDLVALERVHGRCREAGVRASRLPVSHAFHSAQIEPALPALSAAVSDLELSPPSMPIVSTATGGLVGDELTSPEHWVAQARDPVRFADAVRAATDAGAGRFLEVSPRVSLTPHIVASLPRGKGRAVALLRRPEDEARSLDSGLVDAHLAGARVALDRALGVEGAAHAQLPSYPFQRRSYWLQEPSDTGTDAAGTLDAPVRIADRDEWVAVGRIRSHADTARDHRIGGRAIFAGTCQLRLVAQVAEAIGAQAIRELVHEVPLEIVGDEDRPVQVLVGSRDERGCRPVSLHARADGSEWTRHSSGLLVDGPATATATATIATAPAEEDQSLPLSDLYPRLAARGFDYGPSFSGLRQAWRSGATLHARVRLDLPEGGPDGRFPHPGLLDSVFHAALAEQLLDPDREDLPVPFFWQDVEIIGRAGPELVAEIRRRPDGQLSVQVGDLDGHVVLRIGALRPRSIGSQRDQTRLYQRVWQPIVPAPDQSPAGPIEVLDLRNLAETRPGDAFLAGARALQDRIGSAPDGRTVVLTSADLRGDQDPASAALAGLAATAAAEHPGRFVSALAGLDADVTRWETELAATREPAVRLADHGLEAAELHEVARPPRTPPGDFGPTVAITGGTGAVGSAIARHLAVTHGVRHVVVLNRSGADTPAAARVVDALEALDCRAEVHAVDLLDAAALDAALGREGLRTIVHTAGHTADATLATLSAGQSEPHFDVKVSAVEVLAAAADRLGIERLVLCGSAASWLTPAGQGAYAAANAAMEAIARRRTAAGRRTTYIGWGPWASSSGMTSRLSARDAARLARTGLSEMTTTAALAAFDSAMLAETPVAALAIDLAQLRAGRDRGLAPRALCHLAGPATARPAPSAPLRLASGAAPGSGALTTTVREEVAAILGHRVEDISDARPFKDLGLDSLTAVELRNRLAERTALDLEPTFVFDHPTVAAAVARLKSLLTARSPNRPAAPPHGPTPVVPAAPRPASDVGELAAEDLFAVLDQELAT